MTSNLDNLVSVQDRKISLSSRFEVEKVEENGLNSSIKANDDSFNEKNKLIAALASSATPITEAPHSNLKKTTKQYIYDDDFFDLNSGQNTARDKKVYLQSQSSYEKAAQYEMNDFKNDENNEEEEITKKQDPDTTGCFQINYDEKNDPMSITCNLNSDGVNSYKNCIHDFKTVFLYQKLIAEFIGTMLLTLYACSIGLPITENNVPSINGYLLRC